MGVITIKGHHGTDINSCKAILKSNYKISEGDQHWLGEGVYFFIEGLSTDTINLAEKWAIAEAWDNDNKRYKYTDFAPDAKSFQEESAKRIRELYMYDVLRADRCISSNSMEARVPFGDLDFVEYVMSIDPEMKMNKYNKGKYLLRHAFEGDYLPESILMREKAAFSDAVGHSMVDYLKEYAQEKYSDEEYDEKIKKYSFAKPFTKESLLYREIFEEYYPGQAEMVVDFWMPNKAWEGCNVDDPSARVLSNYGESGL